MKTEEYYQHIYRLAFITRYSNLPRIRDESVAEHSFFVAAIILKLDDIYTFDLGLSLTAAVSHDIVESDLCDPVHPIGVRHPNLKAAYKEAELIEIKKYPAAVQDGWKIYEGIPTFRVEGIIAQYADVLQVKQYAEQELLLGNKWMNRVVVDIRGRLSKLKEELEPYEY